MEEWKRPGWARGGEFHEPMLSPVCIADALAAGIPAAALARYLGRPEPWVQAHAALVAPAPRALFAAGRLQSVAAYTRLLDLSPQARRDLLDAGGPITVARCARASGACLAPCPVVAP